MFHVKHPPRPPTVARRVFRSERRGWPSGSRPARHRGRDSGADRPSGAPRLWERHLLNCAVLGGVDPRGRGVRHRLRCRSPRPGPGYRPARSADHPGRAAVRRTTFLEEVVEELGLETYGGARQGRGASTASAVRRGDLASRRSLDRLLTWSMPLVAPTGALVAMKGSSIDEEIARRPTRRCRGWAARRRGLRARRGCPGVHHSRRSGGLGGSGTGRLAARPPERARATKAARRGLESARPEGVGQA